jgi:hypothetical protein
MVHKALGLGILAVSFLVAGSGFVLVKKFRAEATYEGIGSFRITWRGVAYFCGMLLIIFGLCGILPAILLFLP